MIVSRDGEQIIIQLVNSERFAVHVAMLSMYCRAEPAGVAELKETIFSLAEPFKSDGAITATLSRQEAMILSEAMVTIGADKEFGAYFETLLALADEIDKVLTPEVRNLPKDRSPDV